MTNPKLDLLAITAGMVDDIATRRNQPTTEHGQAAIASAGLAIAAALHEVADAIREGRSE